MIRVIDGTRWYVTGDKGYVDDDGFLTIIDRYSRFAKVGGEMVSLSAVEHAVVDSLRDGYHELEVVAVAIPDDRKGEKIVVLCDRDIRLEEIKTAMLEKRCRALIIPSQVIHVEALPKLGSGKTDFSQAKELASTIMTENQRSAEKPS